MSTLSRKFISGVRRRTRALVDTSQQGFTAVEWITIIVVVLAIVALVAVAVNAYVAGQVGKLGS